MTTMAWNNITVTNMETGEEMKILPNSTSVFSCDDCDDADIRQSVNVHNTYKFECTITDIVSSELQRFFVSNPNFKAANRLADQLNDLIEEYHAPGTPRRERRAIKREFDKVFRIFHKHCQKYGIKYSFQRPSK